ncbi:MAG: hypothetical protein QOG10_6219 [Kribbellaceae bacterium]|jgi:hypothetical protein|nr:hypothetical protein [Kribbellaceae bacterium]
MTYSVYPPASTPLPSLDELRNPAKADLSKLTVLPQAAAESLAQYFTGGLKSPKAVAFIPSPGATELLTRSAKSKVDDAKLSYISTASDTFRVSGEPLTFIAKSGEALVFLALSEQYLQRIKAGSNGRCHSLRQPGEVHPGPDYGLSPAGSPGHPAQEQGQDSHPLRRRPASRRRGLLTECRPARCRRRPAGSLSAAGLVETDHPTLPGGGGERRHHDIVAASNENASPSLRS